MTILVAFGQIKPIFHCKLGSRWVPKANEMSTNNMKCTWPTQKFCVGDPTQPIFHWLALGFCVGGNANFIFCIGCNAFLDTNMLLSQTRNCGIGGISQRQDPTQMVLRRSGI